jgi:hypothetical protein
VDIDLARIVSEDLDFLASEWNQDVDDASLRRSSAVLRSLLVEGLLGKAAHEAGRNIRILAPAICQVTTEAELRECKFYQAGGALYKGMMVQSTSIVASAKSHAEIKASYERTKDVIGKNYPLKLGAYLRQTSLVVDGVLISREEVIKYVANKLGGVHYDKSRADQSPQKQVSLEQKYALLDGVRNGIAVADKSAVYYELLSIGQRVVNSRDVQRLSKHLAHVLSLPPVIRA